MSEVQIDVQRMAAIAEQLRQQVPNASAEVARPMIDAAGELQRLVDQFDALQKAQAKFVREILKRAAEECQCANCTARREAEGKSKESLN